MNICLIGNSLTSLVLAKSLVNKKIKVTMYYNNKYLLGDNTRTIGISSSNIKFLQKEIIKIHKSLLWEINHIEVYNKHKRNATPSQNPMIKPLPNHPQQISSGAKPAVGK